MGRLNRREFVLSAAATYAAFGLNGPMAISAPAPDRQNTDPIQGFHRYRIGSAECIALYDGIWEKAQDAALFKTANPKDPKQAPAASDALTDSAPIPVMALVVRVNNKLVLCDAGGGGQVPALDANTVFVSGKLLANLRAAGIDPAEIETILVSHFHPDHIFGLMEAETNRAVFPNAEIIVPGAEYRWWTDTSRVGRLPEGQRSVAKRIQAVLPSWKNILPMDDEDEVVPGIRFVSAPGHTAGHTAFQLSSGEAQLLILGDAVYVPALLAPHSGAKGGYDQDGEIAVETRRKLLDRVIADNMMICGTHFPWPGVGRIAREGAGYAFIL
jgi:glyoxylase-like metal-dependent hydrolase (beta-lactamase superfamily II)